MPTDTDLAASNLTLGTYTPTQLYSGEKPVTTTAYAVKNGAILAKYTVVALTAAGKLAAWDPMSVAAAGNAFATGTLTFSGVGTAADTITLAGTVVTMKGGDATGNNQFNIGATATLSAQAFLALINAYPDLYGVTASGAAAAILLTRRIAGTAGNAYTTTESGTGTSFGGVVLAGGTDIAGAPGPESRAIGVTMQPVDNTGDGKFCPVVVGAVLNPAALVWPSVSENFAADDAAKVGAFARTGIVIRKLF